MSDVFHAGMIPFFPAALPCIPGVMGSGLWELGLSPFSSNLMSYNSGSDYYHSTPNQNAHQMWPTAFSGSQSVSVMVSNFGTPEWTYVVSADYINLTTRMTVDSGEGLSLWFYRDNDHSTTGDFSGPGAGYNWQWWIEYDDGVTSYYQESTGGYLGGTFLPWPYDDSPFELRLESDADGTFRVYEHGNLLVTDVVSGLPTGPSYMGVGTDSNYVGTSDGTSADPGASVEVGVPHLSDICLIGTGEVSISETPTFRSESSTLANLTATVTPPAGVEDGDLLVLCAMRRVSHTSTSNDPFISSTGGQSWTEVGQNYNTGYSCRVWSAIASGTLTNVVIDGTETFSGAATCNAAILVYQAGTFDPSPPSIGVGPGLRTVVPSSGFSVHTVGTVTTAVDNALRLIVAGARRNGVSVYGPMDVDTGWTGRVGLNSATGLTNNSGLVVAEKYTPVAGISGGSDQVTENGGNFVQAFHMSIYPPP